MAGGIPKGLLSTDLIPSISGLRRIRNSLLPVSGGGAYTPEASNKIVFQLPSFENSVLVPENSYFRFNFKTNASTTKLFRNSVCPFKRVVIRNSRGVIIEDIDSYLTWNKINDVLKKTRCDLRGESQTTRAPYTQDMAKRFADEVNFAGTNGVPVIHHLNSGFIGSKHQKYYIPISSLMSSSGFALHIELHLADAKDVVYSTSGSAGTYSIPEIVYETEMLEMSPDTYRDIYGELLKGKQLAIPFKSVRAHVLQMNGQTAFNHKIVESAHDAINAYAVVRENKSALANVADVNAVVSDDDPNTFYGGGKKWLANQEVGDDLVHLTKYVWKTNHSYMPNVPVELPGEKTLALQNNISMLGLKNPFVAETLEGATNMCAEYEARDFIVATTFKKSNDPGLHNGENFSASSSPIQLDLEYSGTVNSKELCCFIESQNVLYLKGNGESSTIKA